MKRKKDANIFAEKEILFIIIWVGKESEGREDYRTLRSGMTPPDSPLSVSTIHTLCAAAASLFHWGGHAANDLAPSQRCSNTPIQKGVWMHKI